jgi:hypothetical protein
MGMRLVALLVALLALFAGSAHASLTTEQAADRVHTAILRSTKVADKTSAFTETFDHNTKGKKRLRWKARSRTGVVLGEIDLVTERVTITAYSAVR